MSLFKESVSYRPFKYPKFMELAVEQNVSLYWHEGQLDLSDDIRQFHSKDGLATENVSHGSNKNMLVKVLNLFTQMDVAAGSLYCELLPYAKNNEFRNWLMAAANKEGIHQRAYALIVEELGFPESTWTEFMEYSEMSNKIEVMTGLSDRDHSKPLDFAKTLCQLLLAEGICLFGAFSCMLNLKRYGIMLGTNVVNQWSLKDEEKHVEGNILAVKEIMKELSDIEKLDLIMFVRDLVKKYVEAEHIFIDLVFEMGDQEGMTKGQLKEYIKYLANLRTYQLGFSPKPEQENPLDWMNWVLSGKQHTNFFEQKVTDYDHSGLVGDIDYGKYKELLK